MKVIKIWIL